MSLPIVGQLQKLADSLQSLDELTKENNQYLLEKLLIRMFLNFNEVGSSLYSDFIKSPPTTIEDQVIPLRMIIMQQVTKHAGWFKRYIPAIPHFQITYEFISSEIDIYRVRSGVQYLFDKFIGISSEFDSILANIKEHSCLEDDYDVKLRSWLYSTCYYPLSTDEIPQNTSHTHWWWFLNSTS